MLTDKLKEILNAALTTKNVSLLYKLIGEVIKEAKKLMNTSQKSKSRTVTIDLTSFINILIDAQNKCFTLEEFRPHITAALQQIDIQEKNLEKKKPRGFHKSVGFVYTKEYKNDRESRLEIIDYINDTEQDIITRAGYARRLHEKVKHGKWAGHLHAHVNDNTIILYTLRPEIVEIHEEEYSGNIIIFERIITKNEFDSKN